MPRTNVIQRKSTSAKRTAPRMKATPRTTDRRRVQTTRRVRTRRERSVLTSAVAVFGVAFFCAWFASSIVGNIALEKERRQRLQVAERLQMVGAEISRLEREVDTLVGVRAVESFVASESWVLTGAPLRPAAPSEADVQPGEAHVVAQR